MCTYRYSMIDFCHIANGVSRILEASIWREKKECNYRPTRWTRGRECAGTFFFVTRGSRKWIYLINLMINFRASSDLQRPYGMGQNNVAEAMNSKFSLFRLPQNNITSYMILLSHDVRTTVSRYFHSPYPDDEKCCLPSFAHHCTQQIPIVKGNMQWGERERESAAKKWCRKMNVSENYCAFFATMLAFCLFFMCCEITAQHRYRKTTLHDKFHSATRCRCLALLLHFWLLPLFHTSTAVNIHIVSNRAPINCFSAWAWCGFFSSSARSFANR